MPVEFVNYVKYSKSLKFEEKPDYNYIRKLFRSLLQREGYELDSLYDWVLLSYTSGRQINRRRPNRYEERKRQENERLTTEQKVSATTERVQSRGVSQAAANARQLAETDRKSNQKKCSLF
jgi:hypothetical protein